MWAPGFHIPFDLQLLQEKLTQGVGPEDIEMYKLQDLSDQLQT